MYVCGIVDNSDKEYIIIENNSNDNKSDDINENKECNDININIDNIDSFLDENEFENNELNIYMTNVDIKVNSNDYYIHVNKSSENKIEQSNYVIKFDSACSRNMSGIKERTKFGNKQEFSENIIVKGFNGNTSQVNKVGLNEDGKIEYYIQDMPSDMVLLCAHDYAKEGAAILFENSGVVLRLSLKEKNQLMMYIDKFIATKRLIVNNRTYEIDNSNNNINTVLNKDEQAMSNTATKFFNSKVYVCNNEERILAMLLTGLSFNDLYSMVKSSSVKGLPRDMTINTLNNFQHKYGKTPDIIQMAIPNLAGNTKGYMAPRKELFSVGERVEADFMQCEFNEILYEDSLQKKTVKLQTFGGATAAYVCVDVYSGYVHGWLVDSVANSVNQVKRTVDTYKKDGHRLQLYAADQGILIQSQFSVIVPEVQRYLNSEKIYMQCGEAYNHDNGLTVSERTVRTVKELMRFAVLYILNNPNFVNLGFTRKQIFQLWGELFSWSLWVIRLKRFKKDNSKTKFEVYNGKQPDLREIRLLPIFAIVYALRRNKTSNPLGSNREFWQRGLYVGPSDVVPGAIRVAVLSKNKVIKVVVTTKFKGVSDGGNINPYNVVDSHINSINIAVNEHLSEENEDKDIKNIDDNGNVVNTNDTTTVELHDNIVPIVESRGVKGNKINKDKTKMMKQVLNWGTREERLKNRNKDKANYAITSSQLISQIEESNFVDWSTHYDDDIYFSFSNNCYYTFINHESNNNSEIIIEEGYKAVTEGIPKSLSAAMSHPVWGEAARKEFEVITNGTGAIVKVNQTIARENINNGADCLIMLAVYEEKVKDGNTIKKVRMVANGKQHKNYEATYSPTPSREEFLIIMHICATNDWDYYWVDEQRAFLTAERNDTRPMYVKFQGDKEIYGVGKALYGTKDASRDYHIKVDNIMYKILLCEKLHMCSCVYMKYQDGNVVIILDHVDDFVFTGNNNEYTLSVINEFRKHVNTDEPIMNASVILGMELERVRNKKVIKIIMKKKINELCYKHMNVIGKKRNVPMPTSGYIVREHELQMLSDHKIKSLSIEDISIYMSIVGTLIWLQGIRLDIIFAVLYLSWNTKAPLQHHMDMANYVIGYLYNTIDIPLVLGGIENINVNVYFDASHGTGPRSRSITGVLAKLNPSAGAIYAKSSAQATIKLSSFESELDGVTTAFKTAARIDNILKELHISTNMKPIAYNDNEANIAFVKGDSVAKGVRHMELRMWYTREEYLKGNVHLEYMKGTEIPADKLTKLGAVNEHRQFTVDIQGLNLISKNYFEEKDINTVAIDIDDK